MRIFQMVDVPWDSGLAHYALLVSQGLKRQGHQVFVSAVPGQKPWLKAKRLGLKTVPLTKLSGLKPLRRFFKEHRIDLVNAHTGATHSLAVAGALGQPVAVVRTRSDARGVKRRIGSSLLYGRTQRVIAAAEYIREAFVKDLKLSPSKVVTIYQGLATDDGPPPLPAEPIIGIVARLDPVKGHRYLLEAISLLKRDFPGLKLKIFGQEENIKVRELQVIAERLRIDQHVEFAGFQQDVPAAMASCRIGVVSSIGSEAVSRVALEWMASARPLVSTDVGCLPEVVEDGRTGFLVPPKNAPALARSIATLLNKPAHAVAMGKAGRKVVENRFALSRFVEETLHTYERALEDMRKNGCRN